MSIKRRDRGVFFIACGSTMGNATSRTVFKPYVYRGDDIVKPQSPAQRRLNGLT